MYYVDEYKADRKRYETMQYNRCGKSGLKLPAVSLGLWHNFGSKLLTMVLLILTWQITMAQSTDLQRKTLDGSCVIFYVHTEMN